MAFATHNFPTQAFHLAEASVAEAILIMNEAKRFKHQINAEEIVRLRTALSEAEKVHSNTEHCQSQISYNEIKF